MRQLAAAARVQAGPGLSGPRDSLELLREEPLGRAPGLARVVAPSWAPSERRPVTRGWTAMCPC
jgi:hypothetical protein